MTCKDCIHYEICSPYTSPNESFPEVNGCKCFKDKCRYIEMPCKVGETIYKVVCDKVKEEYVEKIEIGKNTTAIFYDWHGMGYEISLASDIGKTVFLAREEAEKALKERSRQ